MFVCIEICTIPALNCHMREKNWIDANEWVCSQTHQNINIYPFIYPYINRKSTAIVLEKKAAAEINKFVNDIKWEIQKCDVVSFISSNFTF